MSRTAEMLHKIRTMQYEKLYKQWRAKRIVRERERVAGNDDCVSYDTRGDACRFLLWMTVITS